jgi:hypothetical protein
MEERRRRRFDVRWNSHSRRAYSLGIYATQENGSQDSCKIHGDWSGHTQVPVVQPYLSYESPTHRLILILPQRRFGDVDTIVDPVQGRCRK